MTEVTIDTILDALLLDESPRTIGVDTALGDDASLKRAWATLRRADPGLVSDYELLWDPDWFLRLPYPLRAFIASAAIAQHLETGLDDDRRTALSREAQRKAVTHAKVRADIEREKVRRIRRDRESRA